MTEPDLEGLERAVEDALRTYDDRALHVLGYGELTSVVAWPGADGPWACKRLPVFDSLERFDAYRQVFHDYLAALDKGGVTVHETTLATVPTSDGRLSAYCVQRTLPADTLGPARLRAASAGDGRRLLSTIIDRIAEVISPEVGIDGQLSNWAVDDDRVVYFDITTPLLRDDAGHDRLDTGLFMASLPALLRPVVRRFLLPGILDPYFVARSATLDLLGNLHKEGLAEWVPVGAELANARLDADLRVDEAARFYRGDARMWSALQKMRRIDRGWQRRIRRQTYPFLLPGRIDRKPKASARGARTVRRSEPGSERPGP